MEEWGIWNDGGWWMTDKDGFIFHTQNLKVAVAQLEYTARTTSEIPCVLVVKSFDTGEVRRRMGVNELGDWGELERYPTEYPNRKADHA